MGSEDFVFARFTQFFRFGEKSSFWKSVRIVKESKALKFLHCKKSHSNFRIFPERTIHNKSAWMTWRHSKKIISKWSLPSLYFSVLLWSMHRIKNFDWRLGWRILAHKLNTHGKESRSSDLKQRTNVSHRNSFEEGSFTISANNYQAELPVNNFH